MKLIIEKSEYDSLKMEVEKLEEEANRHYLRITFDDTLGLNYYEMRSLDMSASFVPQLETFYKNIEELKNKINNIGDAKVRNGEVKTTLSNIFKNLCFGTKFK